MNQLPDTDSQLLFLLKDVTMIKKNNCIPIYIFICFSRRLQFFQPCLDAGILVQHITVYSDDGPGACQRIYYPIEKR